MRNMTIGALVALFCVSCSPVHDVTVEKIWDNGYSAFPSIERFNGDYYVSFREGVSHIFDENGVAAGKSRILVSSDGDRWESVALLEKDGYDLRDPKLSVTPDGRMMVIMEGSVYVDKKLVAYTPYVSFSSDGRIFTDPEPVVFDENVTDSTEWLWRVTWHDGVGYGVTYGGHFALLKTVDGVHFDMVKELDVPAETRPSEATVRFDADGRMYIMVRCDAGDKLGRWGVSEAPYTDWQWKDMDFHLGGPDFMLCEDGTVLAGTRYEFPKGICRTMLLRGNLEGDFEETYLLPSGGDTSYPGLIDAGDEIWMVYYSCHESAGGSSRSTIYNYDPSKKKSQRASIYLAKFRKDFIKGL